MFFSNAVLTTEVILCQIKWLCKYIIQEPKEMRNAAVTDQFQGRRLRLSLGVMGQENRMKSLYRMRFEPRASRIKARSVNTSQICSLSVACSPD
jgi:hypothetical protein